MTTRSNLGVDRILSRYSLLLKNSPNMFVGDRVLPTAIVNHPRGKYYTVTPGFGYTSPGYGLLRNSGAAFGRVTTDVSQTDAFNLREYGIEAPVDDIDAEFAGSDALDLRQAATQVAWNTAMIERERDFAALLFNAGGTFSGYTSAVPGGDSQWDHENCNPLTQADQAAASIRQNTGLPRYEISLLVGAGCWSYLRQAPALTAFFQYVEAGRTHLDEATVAKALGIKEVIVGWGVGNNAQEPNSSNADIWDQDQALFFVKTDNPRPLAPHGIGATFTMSGRQAGRVERFREEPRSEIVLCSWLEDRVVTTPSAGYLFTDVLSV